MKAKQPNPLLLTIARRAVPVLDKRPPYALTRRQIEAELKMSKAQVDGHFARLAAEGKLHKARVWGMDDLKRRRIDVVYWVDE